MTNGFNQIRLLKGVGRYTFHEYRKFKKYETIEDDNVEELDRWLIEDEEKAREALSEYCNTYKRGEKLYYVTEYALEFYRANEYGDFLEGSNFEYAEDEVECHTFEYLDYLKVHEEEIFE